MLIVLTCVAILLGVLAAVAIHLLFRLLRRYAATPTAIVGGILSAAAIIICGLIMLTSLDIGVMLAFFVFGVLGACAMVGMLQQRTFEMRWWKTTGIFVAEVCVAIVIGCVMTEFDYPIADVIWGGRGDIPEILESQAHARNVLGTFDAALAGVLLLLETSGSVTKVYR